MNRGRRRKKGGLREIHQMTDKFGDLALSGIEKKIFSTALGFGCPVALVFSAVSRRRRFFQWEGTKSDARSLACASENYVESQKAVGIARAAVCPPSRGYAVLSAPKREKGGAKRVGLARASAQSRVAVITPPRCTTHA
jgi:hypothetical protein